MAGAGALSMPFLYPCLFRTSSTLTSRFPRSSRPSKTYSHPYSHLSRIPQRQQSTLAERNAHLRALAYEPDPLGQDAEPQRASTHLDPSPDDYSRALFTDRCVLTVQSGSGGNGCVAFLREAHVPDGPANGGDGGNGGSVYIQAVKGHTSLHKLARQGAVRAGRGQGGQGKSQGGRRGEDVCIEVPVGTVVRELRRSDPTLEQVQKLREVEGTDYLEDADAREQWQGLKREKWIVYPGATPAEVKRMQMPKPPAPRRSALKFMEPAAPVTLDLADAMEKPMLLAAGGVGGLGNPHFVTREEPKPKIATKGELGVRIHLELELKLLADVGLVGLPNAGKSTLVRAVSGSRTRIGDWQFTTLSPSIGTVVLDDHRGRVGDSGRNRQSFTVADIPGLVEDAHLDRGLGVSFLRHVERARILAFVVDLSAGDDDPVRGLRDLWNEVAEYENLRDGQVARETESRMSEEVVEWQIFGAKQTTTPGVVHDNEEGMVIHPRRPSSLMGGLTPLVLPPISSKPWFVIATKADLPGTQDRYARLAEYVAKVQDGRIEHPSHKENCWKGTVACIPVSAITEGVGGGVDRVKEWVVGLMDGMGV